MAEDQLLTPAELQSLSDLLPHWEVRDGWLVRKYQTPGWSHTLLLVNAIGYVAEAADHHPDLEVGYARVKVKVQTHRVRGLTHSDLELARQIEAVCTWQPPAGGALTGFPRKWVH